MSTPQEEHATCSADPFYFIDRYCWLYEAHDEGGEWVPFHVWNDQGEWLDIIHGYRQIIFLKSRQVGATWLAVAYALWLMVFRPGSIILFFSIGDAEAKDMLSFRLKGMYERLPEWFKTADVIENNEKRWRWKSGSRAQAFPHVGGRSHNASLVVVDEADYNADFEALMTAVKATVDAGGKLLMLSTADKKRPMSLFKQIFRGAVQGKNGYMPIFCSWKVRPERTQEWYDRERANEFAARGSHDYMMQEYPATIEEALAPNSMDKRLPFAWLKQCYQPMEPYTLEELSFNLQKAGIGVAIPEAQELYPP